MPQHAHNTAVRTTKKKTSLSSDTMMKQRRNRKKNYVLKTENICYAHTLSINGAVRTTASSSSSGMVCTKER